MARKFYYDDGKEKHGPVSGDELVQLRAQGVITNETWVRREDNGTWRPLGTVDLSEEEEEARNPSLLTVLRRSGLLWPAVLFILFIAALIILMSGLIAVFWPFIVAGIIAWLVIKMFDSAQ